ncbi:SRPBCC family protein [Portibacter lacus]|uniref:ATPase n=1 Tax=Portibacter lacus TaxID=1099794 RepID=A0AA37WFN4_9BACT|nr:ATPase [Portibacter lacus]
MVDIVTQVEIDKPISLVSAYASDPDNTTSWYVNIDSIEWITPKPLQVGSLLAFKARFLGKDLSYTYEVVESIPNKKFVMRTADGPFPMETTYTWEALSAEKTKMTLRNRGNPTGFKVFLAPLMKMAMRRANNNDLQKLKEILESI